MPGALSPKLALEQERLIALNKPMMRRQTLWMVIDFLKTSDAEAGLSFTVGDLGDIQWMSRIRSHI